MILMSSISFGQEEREIMYRFIDPETGDDCGYLNKNGDTLIPKGDCMACFSDSLSYAIVVRNNHRDEGFPAIDSKGNVLFNLFVYDNGPDYIEDGMMRIIKGGKIGFANEAGQIIIPPQYEAAWPFENFKTHVSYKATKVQDGEHWFWSDTHFFWIDANGHRLEETKESLPTTPR